MIWTQSFQILLSKYPHILENAPWLLWVSHDFFNYSQPICLLLKNLLKLSCTVFYSRNYICEFYIWDGLSLWEQLFSLQMHTDSELESSMRSHSSSQSLSTWYIRASILQYLMLVKFMFYTRIIRKTYGSVSTPVPSSCKLNFCHSTPRAEMHPLQPE